VVSSPALRAAQTADAVVRALGLSRADLALDERLYLAAAHEILDLVAGVPASVEELLVVGHNPGISQVAAHAACSPRILLTPGSLAHIAFETAAWDAIGAARGTLSYLVTPDDLR
jgi:phosphohistidine phosphatase